MYNLLFGQNRNSEIILATIGRTRDDFHRFRDCFVADGKIAVYTRNGGGNRDCWHEDAPEYGMPECKHHTIVKPVHETVELPEEEAKAKGYRLLNVWVGSSNRMAETGRIVDQTYYVCESPGTADCHCTGCFMTFHIHNLPFYSHDLDDEFDSTYATIYFNFPPAYADGLHAIDSGKPFDPDERWHKLFEALKTKAVAS